MDLVAVCPNCHVSNPPTNTQCEVCKIALGANLADANGKRSTWLFIALTFTLMIGLPMVGFQAHVVAVVIPMFWGPMIASYLSRGNVVSTAAAGGIIGTVLLFFLAAGLHWADVKAMLISLVGMTTKEDWAGDKAASAVLFGIPLVAMIAMATCLAGASVGEHLSAGRRNRASTRPAT